LHIGAYFFIYMNIKDKIVKVRLCLHGYLNWSTSYFRTFFEDKQVSLE
jgi:hypothetical protein